MKKDEIESNRGITLIALVITIIVLLILAGVTINLTIGENGIFKVAQEAREKQKISEYREKIELARAQVELDNMGEVSIDNLIEEIYKEKIVPQNSITKLEDGNRARIVTQERYIFIITKEAISYMGTGEERKIQKPKIGITSGTEGENGYYKSDVTIEIKKEEDSTNKIAYTMAGATKKEESNIQESKSITITEEGETQVTAYVYDEVGNKSEVETVTIKKDSIVPTIELKQKDTTSKEYEKTVEAKIEDETSGIQTKKYEYENREISYFNTNGRELQDEFIATTKDNGVPQYVYTVYAKDKAGNEAIKTITVENMLIDSILTGKNFLAVTGDGLIDNETGKITIPKGVTQFGPYWNLPKGKYEITYKGRNLSTDSSAYKCKVYNASTVTTRWFEVKIKTSNSNEVVFETEIPEDNLKGVEITYSNTSDITTEIDYIELKQLSE